MLRIRLRDWPWALKLAALLVLTAVVPVCVLTVYSDWLLRVAAIAGARERNLLRARTTSKLLDAYLSNVVADVTIVALAPETVSALNHPGDPARLQELSTVLAGIARTQRLPVVTVMDYTGRVIASTDSRIVGADRLAAPHFLSARSGQTRVRDPAFVAADGQAHGAVERLA